MVDGHMTPTSCLTAAVDGCSYGVQGITNLTISCTNGNEMDAKHYFCVPLFVRAIDLITGLPSIKYFDLLPILTSDNLSNTPCCRICEVLRSVRHIISPCRLYDANNLPITS